MCRRKGPYEHDARGVLEIYIHFLSDIVVTKHLEIQQLPEEAPHPAAERFRPNPAPLSIRAATVDAATTEVQQDAREREKRESIATAFAVVEARYTLQPHDMATTRRLPVLSCPPTSAGPSGTSCGP